MKKRIASLTSNILNPFLVSFVFILLLSFKSTPSALDAIKWSLISVAASILPVFGVIVYLVRSQKLESIFINVRKQRTKIYLLAGVCGVVGYVILYYLEAPRELIATFMAGLSAVFVFMCVNFFWKISLHTALIAASVTVLIILYGSVAAVSVALVPLIGWSRIELKHHSPAQVTAGALLAAVIVVVVFYLFGLV